MITLIILLLRGHPYSQLCWGPPVQKSSGSPLQKINFFSLHYVVEKWERGTIACLHSMRILIWGLTDFLTAYQTTLCSALPSLSKITYAARLEPFVVQVASVLFPLQAFSFQGLVLIHCLSNSQHFAVVCSHVLFILYAFKNPFTFILV